MRFELPRIFDARDYILAAFLLVIAAVLLIARNEDGIRNIRKASITVFSYMQEPLSDLRVYSRALKTNNELRKQNILLLDELNQLRSARQKNEELKGLLGFSKRSNLSLHPVQIIGKELNQTNNVLTVDAGSSNGIEEGMPFISANGLIGKVVLTSQNYAQVMPYYNTLFRVSAKLQHSNAYGIIRWSTQNTDMLQLMYVPQTIRVDTGEVVVTSGYSYRYPPGIPIGKVVDREPVKGKDNQQITIKPFVNLYSVSAGFIVTSKPDSSLEMIDKNYKKLFK